MNTVFYREPVGNVTNLCEALWDRADEGENYNCNEEQICQFIMASCGDVRDPKTGTLDPVFVPDADVESWAKLFKFWLEGLKFTTRTQVVEFLVQHMGMEPKYAMAGVDQQYNYDNGDLLCGNDEEDLQISHVATVGEVIMVHRTWVDMLTTDADGWVCVDGEPMYDHNGVMAVK